MPTAPVVVCLREEIVVFDRAELFCSVGATAERLAIPEFLDVAETCGDAAIAVAVVTIEGYADPAVAAGVHFVLVDDGLDRLVHDLRSLTAVGVEEIAALVRLVVGTVNVAVAQRGLEVTGDFAAPLGNGIFLGLLNGGLDSDDRRRIGLGDDCGNAVLGVSAVYRIRLPACR